MVCLYSPSTHPCHHTIVPAVAADMRARLVRVLKIFILVGGGIGLVVFEMYGFVVCTVKDGDEVKRRYLVSARPHIYNIPCSCWPC